MTKTQEKVPPKKKRKTYPLDLKFQVIEQYKPGKVGYKLLATQFGLQRDTVRDWVHSEHLKEQLKLAKKEQRQKEKIAGTRKTAKK
ncbi:MAG: hypothetical protein IJ191_01975 [Treponema sp.]|nr:hypothetical protein [Treponema sp.]